MRYHVPQLGRLRRGRAISKLGAMLHGGIRTASVERDRHEIDGESDLDSTGRTKCEDELPAECSTSMRDVLRRFVCGVKRRMGSSNEEREEGEKVDRSTGHENLQSHIICPPRPALIVRDHTVDDDTMDDGTVESLASSRTRSVSFNAVVKAMPIETRQQRYGDAASKRAAFYSQSDVAAFKKSLLQAVHARKRASVKANREWYWQADDSCALETEEGHPTCECEYTWCKLPESRADSRPDLLLKASPRQTTSQSQDFSRWVWQERPRRPVSPLPRRRVRCAPLPRLDL